MTCGNRRFDTWNHKPNEIISYQQDFFSIIRAGLTITGITATSIADDIVLIVNETTDLVNGIWRGQLIMTAVGNGIVQIEASTSDGQLLQDFFHICTRDEEVVV